MAPKVRHRSQRAGGTERPGRRRQESFRWTDVAIGVITVGHLHQLRAYGRHRRSCGRAPWRSAAGELLVSVSSQRDTERAGGGRSGAFCRCIRRLRGRSWRPSTAAAGSRTELANDVADALTASDALGAHARDELGLAAIQARPVQAAVYSALSFTAGAPLPILRLASSPRVARTLAVVVSALAALVTLGVAGARAGGASDALGAAVRVRAGEADWQWPGPQPWAPGRWVWPCSRTWFNSVVGFRHRSFVA